MQVQISEIKLIELFIDVDDLLKSFQAYQQSRQVGQARRPTRIPELSEPEICTNLSVTVCDPEHTRHRKPRNALAHIAGALIA